MTVHPFRPTVPDDDPSGAHTWPDVWPDDLADPADDLADDEAVDRLARLFDLYPAPIDRLVELVAALPDGRDRFASFDRDHVLAHRAISPGLLAGLCWLDLSLCQAFHAALFELLEDIGTFNGMIATAGFYADATTGRIRDADEWVWDHPVPAADVVDRATRDAIADHSLELASAMGSNPSLTFASPAALRERLLEGVLEHGPDLEVTGEQIDWLVDLTFRLLAEVRHDLAIVGGVRVWVAEPLRKK